jgi:hypothetical protein
VVLAVSGSAVIGVAVLGAVLLLAVLLRIDDRDEAKAEAQERKRH